MSVKEAVIYPDSDGKPMSDNTKQARWIVLFFSNLCTIYRSVADVFVAMNNLWYPVEGEPETRAAPDVYVVFGRPKHDRGSYRQWEEGGIPLTVVFEILSPGNTQLEMDEKLLFYETHGVEEYYIYNPDRDRLTVYIRGPRGGALVRQRFRGGSFTSPRLKIRFDTSGDEMRVYRPDGTPFRTLEESEARAARLVELGRKARRGLASPEEVAELERLEGE